MSKIYDMTGKRYGSLVAVKPTGIRSRANNRLWEFVCDCGATTQIDGYDVRSGKRTQCRHCSAEDVAAKNRKHGLTETAEFGVWTDIQTRCHNPNSKAYSNYGGRGIVVCDKWRSSFLEFLNDMGPRPKGTEIERIDNDGNYEPSNCRWASRKEQALNRRTNLRVTISGVTKTAIEWAREYNIKPHTIYRRIRFGWVGRALISPAKRCL